VPGDLNETARGIRPIAQVGGVHRRVGCCAIQANLTGYFNSAFMFDVEGGFVKGRSLPALGESDCRKAVVERASPGEA